MSNGELILYTSPDGAARIQLRAVEGTVWLSLNQIADLFRRDKSVISRHIKAILEEGELVADSVVARYATTAADGKIYQVDYYNLDMILAVGYRVRSERGVEFRRWATITLKEYLLKGFALDDSRLDTADLRARRRQTMRLSEWEGILDGFLQMNDLPLLGNAGSVSAMQAERVAHQRYEAFDTQRKEQLAAGEQSDIAELEEIASQSNRKGLASK